MTPLTILNPVAVDAWFLDYLSGLTLKSATGDPLEPLQVTEVAVTLALVDNPRVTTYQFSVTHNDPRSPDPIIIVWPRSSCDPALIKAIEYPLGD